MFLLVVGEIVGVMVVLVVSEDDQESELVTGAWWVSGIGLFGRRKLVCLVCRSGWRALVNMSAVLFLELTPPIRMPFSMLSCRIEW